MKTFLALLYKDFLISRSYIIGFGLATLAFPFFTVFVLGGSAGYTTIAMISTMVIFARPIGIDRKSKWEEFLYSSPVKARVLVIVRYFEMTMVLIFFYLALMLEKKINLTFATEDMEYMVEIFDSLYLWLIFGFSILILVAFGAPTLIFGIKKGFFVGIGALVVFALLFYVIGASAVGLYEGADEAFVSFISKGSFIVYGLSFIACLIFAENRQA